MLSHILENQCRILRSFKQQKQQHQTGDSYTESFSLSFMLKTLTLAESLAYQRVCFNTPCWLLAQLKTTTFDPSSPAELPKQSPPMSPQHQE
jgi:hypothetical protein